MTNRRLKIWGLYWQDHKRMVIATYTQKEAASLVGCSLHHFRGYASETANSEEVKAALSKPFAVFWKDSREYDAAYTERNPACPYCGHRFSYTEAERRLPIDLPFGHSLTCCPKCHRRTVWSQSLHPARGKTEWARVL